MGSWFGTLISLQNIGHHQTSLDWYPGKGLILPAI